MEHPRRLMSLSQCSLKVKSRARTCGARGNANLDATNYVRKAVAATIATHLVPGNLNAR